MKNFKRLFLITFLSILVFTSCENEDTLIEPVQETEESPAIMQAMQKMANNVDNQGNVIANSQTNPTGNMVFDFGFDFVYPITLSYNNGSTITVNSFSEFVNVLINSTDQLFINGISFPFDVEVYDETTNSIVVVTINNETEFEDLLDSLDSSSSSGCGDCGDVYAPVCVDVTDPYGQVFTVTYPNECLAQCDGFTQADFNDNCMDSNYFDFGAGCFDMIYPFDMLLDDGTTLTINSDTEFGNAMYNQYVVNFVYPLTITLEADGSQVVINDEEDFQVVIDNCYANDDDNPYDCDTCQDQPIVPVCVQYTIPGTNDVITDIFPNECYAFCAGYTADNIVTCPDDNTELPDCTGNDILNELANCNEWYINGSQPNIYIFDTTNSTVEVTFEDGSFISNGTWSIIFEQVSPDPSDVIPLLNITMTNTAYSDSWIFDGCNPNEPVSVHSIYANVGAIESNCD
jgi:hypothetical protein